MREVGDSLCEFLASDDNGRDDHQLDAEGRHASDACAATQPAMIAARAMFRMAAGTRLLDLGSGPRLLILAVPDYAWASVFVEAFRLFVKGGRPPSRLHALAERTCEPDDWIALTPDGRRGNLSTDEASRALLCGAQVVGATHDLDATPPALAGAADRVVHVGSLDWAVLRHVAETLCGPSDDWPLEPVPSADELAAIGPTALALAMRPDDDAPAYAERVLRVVRGEVRAAAKAKAVKPDGGLARVPGLGEALEWGRSLATDLRAYAAGNLPWSAVDRGALLVGPPGVGKTTFGAALAEECGVTLMAASYAGWQASGHQGQMLKAMRASFAEAKEAAPCILFIDEIDSFLDRDRVGSDHASYLRGVVNGLLAEVDGIGGREGVVILGACNDAAVVDPALRRAGRLDRTIRVDLPSVPGRVDILRVHLGRELPGADLYQVARLAQDMSGADLERLVREARRAARLSRRDLMLGDLLVAVAEAQRIDLTSPVSQMTN